MYWRNTVKLLLEDSVENNKKPEEKIQKNQKATGDKETLCDESRDALL